jgi:hypothetical protein
LCFGAPSKLLDGERGDGADCGTGEGNGNVSLHVGDPVVLQSRFEKIFTRRQTVNVTIFAASISIAA